MGLAFPIAEAVQWCYVCGGGLSSHVFCHVPGAGWWHQATPVARRKEQP